MKFHFVILQSGHIWGNSLQKLMPLPSPTDWGWQDDQINFSPKYITTQLISNDLPQLVICKCMKACRLPCKCRVMKVACTLLCKCHGECQTVIL